jgi:prophage antirepressor-like protein
MNVENKEIEIYSFKGKNIRVVGTFETPLFAVKDICNILEIVNVTTAVSNIPDKWKTVRKFLRVNSNPLDMLCVNEAGLYKLIMRSNKPIAEKFQEWVCEDVLPSIRKKGEFILEEYKKQLEEKSKELEVQKQQVKEQDKKIVEQKQQLIEKETQAEEDKIILKLKQEKIEALEYAKKNPEKVRQNQRNNYNAHKDEKITCGCGSVYARPSKKSHVKTQKHLAWEASSI